MKPILLVVTLLAACGDAQPGGHRTGPGGEGPGPGGEGPGPGGEALINGVPAGEYYDQFTWEATDTYVVGLGTFPAQDDTRDAFLVHLYLMGDGGFILFYEEGQGEAYYSGWSLLTFDGTLRRREGTWSIDGTELDVGGLLRCSGFSYNGEEMLECGLASRIVSDVAVGYAATLEIDDFGASSPNDEEWHDYRE